MGSVLHKVIRPHVVAMLGAKPKARSVGQPEPAALGLFGWNFQPLLSPDPLNPLVVDDPASACTKQLRYFAVAVAAILTGKLDDVGCQRCFVITPLRRLALGGTVLSERCARATLGDLEFTPHVLDHGTAARGAYQFPLAASFKISLSNVRSDTARRSRVFSCSSSFIRLT